MSKGIYIFCLKFYGLYTCLLKTIKFWKHITNFILTWAPWCYALTMMTKLWKQVQDEVLFNENTEWHFMQSFELNSNSLELDLLNSNSNEFRFNWIKFKLSWREMGCKLKQNNWNFSYHFHHLWLWCWKEKALKTHRSKKTHFHSI
jgi:hypothetical protein